MNVQIGTRTIGSGFPCFIAAEIGVNHNGDIHLAHQAIDAAADAGVDGVKFQHYQTEDFLTDRSLMCEYTSQGNTVRESQYEMFKRYEMSKEIFAELKKHCDERGVLFHCTPTSEQRIAELVEIGTELLKNSSDQLDHLRIIQAMGKTGLPTILSTGMGNMEEIERAIETFRKTGNDKVIVLHCTSEYPTPPEDVRLRRMSALAERFGCLVGLSDHSQGITAALGAVALGACWIEKHFTLDRDLPGPDHWFSSTPNEMRLLVESVRTLERQLAGSLHGPTQREQALKPEFRFSCAATRSLSSGHILSKEDIVYRRPGTGIPPIQESLLIGQRLNRDIEAGQLFELSNIQSL